MKVKEKQPLQSFHAFLRHSGAGGDASLLTPIYRSVLRTMHLAVGFCIISLYPVFAQNQSEPPKKPEEKRLDLLFERIMQTLPDEARVKVDSAATQKNSRGPAVEKAKRAAADKKNTDTEKAFDKTTRLRELPPELKAQVERAMVDMNERNLERKAQFIESRHKKK
jgi:hypothetical protein